MASPSELQDRFRTLNDALEALPDVTEPPKTTLRVIGQARAEAAWNALLAYFLNPTQPHGFGTTLLKAFIEEVNQATAPPVEYLHRDLERARVSTEIRSAQGNQLDIVVRVPGRWFICIECKVDSSEGTRQTHRYVEDPELGSEDKSTYPQSGRHYVFISRQTAADAAADGFTNLSWSAVADRFAQTIRQSRGRYPERSVSQLNDFIDTITEATAMDTNDFTDVQQEKVHLLGEYRDDIEELYAAANSLREHSIDRWPELFTDHIEGSGAWSEEWTLRPDKYGCMYRDGWYRDAELNPVTDHNETRTGDLGTRLHLIHLIRNESSFRDGQLTMILRCPTNNRVRSRFRTLYRSGEYQDRIRAALEPHDITNKANQRDYTRKQYDVDQTRLPESYFETLATAFEEHAAFADVVDEIITQAVADVKADL